MSNDAHTLYRRWIEELWNGAPAESVADLVHDDFVGHWPDRDVRGRDELLALTAETRAVLTDLHFEVTVGPIVEGDLVAGRWTGQGRQDGTTTSFFGNDLLRLRDGRFVEYWTASSAGS